MKSVLIIALNTFSEARHNKVLFIALGFAAVLIIFSLFMGEVSLYQNEKVVKDIGLASISLLGIFVSIFMGVTSLYTEMEKRTIYTIVSKPIYRYEILLGKYLGMIIVLSWIVVLMSIFLQGVTFFIESKFDWALMPAIGLILVELLVVGAIAIFFSSFSSPFLSGLFTGSLFMIGRVTHELGQFGERSKNELFRFLATNIQKIYDLEAFNLRDQAVHKLPIYAEDIWNPILYATFLISLLLFLSVILFQKRDFK